MRLRIDNNCDDDCVVDRCAAECGGCGGEDPVETPDEQQDGNSQIDADTAGSESDSDNNMTDSTSSTTDSDSIISGHDDEESDESVGCGCSLI